MEDGAFTPTTMSETLPEHNTMDFDLVEELFYDGCWLETTDGSSFWQPGPSTSSALNLPSYCFPTSGNNMGHLDPNPWQEGNQEELPQSNFSDNPPPVFLQTEQLDTSEVQNPEAILTLASGQSETFLVEDTEMSRRLWIAPTRNLSSNSSVKKRLMWAIEYLKESTRDRDVLVQIWVPIKSRGKLVLTTNNQPFSLNPSYKNLADYRNVSRRYQFAVEENSKDMVGLPGRVFLKKLPDWTPDVRFFKREEYPRINDAQRYNVCGSLALPVFERGSGNCLGVVEIVTTTQKANYHPELENICKALEAVDLRGSVICSPPKLKAWNESYQIALMEIQEVLTTVCNMHGLPLAQAWAPCIQHDKDGCRHANENYTACVSTIDSAYCAPSPQGLGFREACSEHHLLIGEGVAGEAFMTNQPCFAADITAFSKTEYRLSHHARMFGLHAAVAIRLRCIYTGSADFVLEFFLPLSCQNAEEHKQMLNSLSSVIQEVCRSLRVVTEQELQEETRFPVRETVTYSGVRHNEEVAAKFLPSSSKEPSYEESSWIAHMMEAQQKGKGVAVSLEYPNDELKEEFKMTTLWHNSDVNLHHEQVSDQKQHGQDSGIKGIDGGGKFSSASGHCPPGARKAGEKRRMKTEKAISLQVLRQYFSGSLKDAAKSIGVCPTTLKRICRQHGITRWPSRKIKKVSHSLRKLQLVIDSVQGAEGSIQLASFYTNFPELSPGVLETTSFTTTKTNDHLRQLNTQGEGSLLSPGTTSSKSHSSSCNHSSSSSLCCSTGAKQPTITAGALGSGSGDALLAEKPTGVLLKRARSDAGLQDAGQEETKVLPRSQSHNIFGEHPNIESVPPLLKSSHHQVLPETTAFRVKASFGEEKIRFSMQQNWRLGDLQREIAKRFSIGDTCRIDLKYLDDESEWVLLTCDDDLEECIDIHRSSKSHTIKLSLDFSSHPNLGSSFGSTSPS